MTVNNSLNKRQSDPGPLEFLRPVQPLEHSKKLMGVPGIKTDPGVPDEIDTLPILRAATDFNPAHIFGCCKFDCIGNQIPPNLSQE
jgi:hypothetical protein